jgi:hypothetical protein
MDPVKVLALARRLGDGTLPRAATGPRRPRTMTPRAADRRRAAAAVLTATTALLTVALGAGPAAAHGAPVNPVSRAAACAPRLGLFPDSTACRAATARRGQPFNDWDNIRVAGVDGRDRQTIPDRKLCSGGRDEFSSLDQPRGDWPSTRLTPGAGITVRYSSTIPHQGEFRVYLSKQGYDPAKPLAWSDIPQRPFMKAENPRLANGAYRISGRLPTDRTGRQVIFTVWQNTSTPDTYYSCSDVVFPGPAPGAGGGRGTGAGAGGEENAGTRRPPPATAPTSGSTPALAGSASATKSPARHGAHSAPRGKSVSAEKNKSNASLFFGLTGTAVLFAGAIAGTTALRRQRSRPLR